MAAILHQRQLVANFLTRIVNFFRPEQRASLQNPSQWMFDLWGQPTKSGIAINQETALAHTALFACLKVLGESVAALPLSLYQKTDEGSRMMEGDFRNTLASLEPSELYHSFDFRNTMMLHLGLHGNAYARIIRNGQNRPVELRILQPDQVLPFITPEGALFYKVANERLPLAPRDILHLKGVSTDGIVGKSPISVFRETIALGIATTQTQGSLWKNGTLINGYLKHPLKMTQDEGKRLSESWRARYSGIDNAGNTPVLENGMEFIPLSLKPADAMFLETAKLSRNDICAIFRVPPHMIGDLERSTNNNIEQQSLEFVRNTLLPYLKAWEMEFGRKLLFDGEKGRLFFRFNVDGLLRGDTKSRAEYYTRALGSVSTPGWMAPDEVRMLENMNILPDGAGSTVYNPTMNQQTQEQTPDTGQDNGTNTTDESEGEPAAN